MSGHVRLPSSGRPNFGWPTDQLSRRAIFSPHAYEPFVHYHSGVLPVVLEIPMLNNFILL